MPSVEASVTIDGSIERLCACLGRRYDGDAHPSASLQAKGQAPRVRVQEARAPTLLRMEVSARHAWLGPLSFVGWRWSHASTREGVDQAHVVIRHEWGWLFALLGMGTTRHRAADESVETVMALEAFASAGSFGA